MQKTLTGFAQAGGGRFYPAQSGQALADALLIAAIALLRELNEPGWMTPALKQSFVVSYVVLAPLVGAFADSMPKGRVMLITNAIKVIGCTLMLFTVHPLLAYAVVGFGAAAYSPASSAPCGIEKTARLMKPIASRCRTTNSSVRLASSRVSVGVPNSR